MKKIIVLSFCLVMVFAAVAFAVSGTGLTGTQHALLGAPEICAACHTPHAAVASTNGPLWNRTGAQTAAGGYSYYTVAISATFDAGASTLGSQSLACMTCHNGIASTIVNGPGSGIGSPAPYAVAGSITNSIGANSFSNIGFGSLSTNNDLTNDHPVGFTYVAGNDANGANAFPVIAANNRITGTYMPTFATKIECATCHDVHNLGSGAFGAAEVNFLRQTNIGSAMCVACHTAKG